MRKGYTLLAIIGAGGALVASLLGYSAYWANANTTQDESFTHFREETIEIISTNTANISSLVDNQAKTDEQFTTIINLLNKR